MSLVHVTFLLLFCIVGPIIMCTAQALFEHYTEKLVSQLFKSTARAQQGFRNINLYLYFIAHVFKKDFSSLIKGCVCATVWYTHVRAAACERSKML